MLKILGVPDEPEVITYNFRNEMSSLVSKTKIEQQETSGYFGISVGQNVQSDYIKYKKVTLLKTLATVGAQAFSLIAITRLILFHYQKFSYHMDALKSLYYE